MVRAVNIQRHTHSSALLHTCMYSIYRREYINTDLDLCTYLILEHVPVGYLPNSGGKYGINI